LLIVVDMQNDFVDGPLGTVEARAIVDPIARLLRQTDDEIWFTLDTHGNDYLDTVEGHHLPVPHCIAGTEGHRIAGPLVPYLERGRVFEKPTFGSVEMAREIEAMPWLRSVDLVGVCTDICVVSNAILIKAFRPDLEVSVLADYCAGTDRKNHLAALQTLSSCQIATK
jgi:nicotinamidase-related amidase